MRGVGVEARGRGRGERVTVEEELRLLPLEAGAQHSAVLLERGGIEAPPRVDRDAADDGRKLEEVAAADELHPAKLSTHEKEEARACWTGQSGSSTPRRYSEVGRWVGGLCVRVGRWVGG